MSARLSWSLTEYMDMRSNELVEWFDLMQADMLAESNALKKIQS